MISFSDVHELVKDGWWVSRRGQASWRNFYLRLGRSSNADKIFVWKGECDFQFSEASSEPVKVWIPTEGSKKANDYIIVGRDSRAPNKKENVMKDIAKTIKDDGQIAANTVLARQLARATRSVLVTLATKHLGADHGMVIKALKTPAGLSIVKICCGVALWLSSFSKYDEVSGVAINRAAAIADSLRQDGLTDGGDLIVSLLTEPVFSEIRVALDKIIVADSKITGADFGSKDTVAADPKST